MSPYVRKKVKRIRYRIKKVDCVVVFCCMFISLFVVSFMEITQNIAIEMDSKVGEEFEETEMVSLAAAAELEKSFLKKDKALPAKKAKKIKKIKDQFKGMSVKQKKKALKLFTNMLSSPKKFSGSKKQLKKMFEETFKEVPKQEQKAIKEAAKEQIMSLSDAEKDKIRAMLLKQKK